MQGIGFTDEVGAADLSSIIAAAQVRLAATPPATVKLGPATLVGEGILYWASPAQALNPARDAVRAAIADVWGPDQVPEAAEWWPHVSVAYASADGPGAPFQAALNGLDDVAEVTIQAVDLIRLGRDQHLYEWEAVERFSLSSAG